MKHHFEIGLLSIGVEADDAKQAKAKLHEAIVAHTYGAYVTYDKEGVRMIVTMPSAEQVDDERNWRQP